MRDTTIGLMKSLVSTREDSRLLYSSPRPTSAGLSGRLNGLGGLPWYNRTSTYHITHHDLTKACLQTYVRVPACPAVDEALRTQNTVYVNYINSDIYEEQLW